MPFDEQKPGEQRWTPAIGFGLSPKVTLAGIITITGIAITGAVLKPELSVQIIGFCTVTVAVLLNMLKGDYIVNRIDANDRKTDQAAEVVRADVRKAEKVQSIKLENIEQKVNTVVEQTNGSLTKKLDSIDSKVDDLKDKLPDPPPPK